MAKRNTTLSQERLKELLNYDPKTGLFTWRVRRGMAVAGSVAGNKNQTGYVHIHVDNKPYKAHRLAWLYVHGSFPADLIDHVNGIRDDNRVANLRPVTYSENVENQVRTRANNSLGLAGVYDTGSGLKRFRATIRKNGKIAWLKDFSTPEAAHKAYVEKKKELHGIDLTTIKPPPFYPRKK